MKSKIIIGAIDLSFHKVTAGIFHNVLEYCGYEIELIYKPHEEMFLAQRNQDIDLLISAWLPGSHDKYLNLYKDDVKLFTTIYEPYCIWAIPDYLANKGVSSIEDLKNPLFSQIIDKEINGIGMGAGISRFSIEIMNEYGLNINGYFFRSNSPDAFYKIVENKLINKENFVIPLWHPQYLHHIFNLYPLKDSKGLLRGKDLATPVLLKKSIPKLLLNELDAISKITLGNDTVSTMDYLLNKENYSAKEASLKWIKQKFNSVDSYVNYLKKK